MAQVVGSGPLRVQQLGKQLRRSRGKRKHSNGLMLSSALLVSKWRNERLLPSQY
jgi:hypothetical protein